MATNRFGQAAQLTTPGAATVKAVPARVPDTKYTVILSPALGESLDEDVQRLRRDTGMKVVRSDVIRSLIRQLHADESLYDSVLQDLVARA